MANLYSASQDSNSSGVTERQSSSPDAAPPDRNAQLREFLADQAWGLSVTCDVLASFVDLEDDAGIQYAVRRVVAHAKAIRDAAKLMFVSDRENGHG